MNWYEIKGVKSKRLLTYLTFIEAKKHGWQLCFNSKVLAYLKFQFVVNGINYGLHTMCFNDDIEKQLNKLKNSTLITINNVTTKEYLKSFVRINSTRGFSNEFQ